MDNYHYIVSSLPVLTPEYRFGSETPEEILEQIVSQCSEKDQEVISFLSKGLDATNLSEDFYREALCHKNRFVREYFRFDLIVRNAKVEYLNKELGREAGKDVVDVCSDKDDEAGATIAGIDLGEFAYEAQLKAALESKDILSRERSMDLLYWDMIGEQTVFDWFSLETVLGFIAKLSIVSRWYRLDETTGREMFRSLVDEVRGTFKGVNYTPEA